MAKVIYLFVTIFCTLFFFNYKITKSAKVIAFQEFETPTEAVCSFIGMVMVALLWAFYFAIF